MVVIHVFRDGPLTAIIFVYENSVAYVSATTKQFAAKTIIKV